MPVIKIFTTAALPPHAGTRLGDRLERLALDVLMARPEDVQVMVIDGVACLKGQGTLVETHFRLRPDRNQAVLARFMDGVEAACLDHLGDRPRVRCFAVEQSTLSARN